VLYISPEAHLAIEFDPNQHHTLVCAVHECILLQVKKHNKGKLQRKIDDKDGLMWANLRSRGKYNLAKSHPR
jgi:hypothetical protein